MKMNEFTVREQQTYDRFRFMRESSEVLLKLFEKDLKNVDALAVVLKMNGYKFETSQLSDFFNFRVRDPEILAALKDCLNKNS